MNNFSLTKMKNGTPVRTKKGERVEFVAVLAENIPARLVVSVGGLMTNYYMDGTYLGHQNPSDDDLKMDGLFD